VTHLASIYCSDKEVTLLYLSPTEPTALEHDIAETIRLRVERMVHDSPTAPHDVAARLGIEVIALQAMLGRWWSVSTALRVADQLDFQELRSFATALRAAA
jgi:hypothetical protein